MIDFFLRVTYELALVFTLHFGHDYSSSARVSLGCVLHPILWPLGQLYRGIFELSDKGHVSNYSSSGISCRPLKA